MTGERNTPGTHPIPYESMTEQLASEQLKHIERTYGTNAHVILANLPNILHEYGHDCLVLGAELVDTFPDVGVVDIMEAYVAGIEHGKSLGGE